MSSQNNRGMPGDKLLEIRGLRVNYETYRGELKVLNGIELYVRKGERVGLIGESGSGKTTALKTVLKILPPNAKVTSGEILYRGRDLLRLSPKEINSIRRHEIAMVFQDPMAALNPVFKVRDQLIDVIKHSSDEPLTKEELLDRAYKLLQEVMLPDVDRVLDSYPFQLSGGMRQRVVIAMALASAKELLLADEPTTNLDVTIQDQILRLIAELVERRRLSVVLVSHALGAVRKMTSRTYVMYAGDVIEGAYTGKLFQEPLHPYTQLLEDSAPKLTGRWNPSGIPGRVPDYLNPPSGCRFHPRCPYSITRCKERKPPMIEISNEHYVMCWLYYKR